MLIAVATACLLTPVQPVRRLLNFGAASSTEWQPRALAWLSAKHVRGHHRPSGRASARRSRLTPAKCAVRPQAQPPESLDFCLACVVPRWAWRRQRLPACCGSWGDPHFHPLRSLRKLVDNLAKFCSLSNCTAGLALSSGNAQHNCCGSLGALPGSEFFSATLVKLRGLWLEHRLLQLSFCQKLLEASVLLLQLGQQLLLHRSLWIDIHRPACCSTAVASGDMSAVTSIADLDDMQTSMTVLPWVISC